MQMLKKFNIRTTGILTFAIFSFVIYFTNTIFRIFCILDMLRINTLSNDYIVFGKYDEINITRILYSIILPLIFVLFLFALYFYNKKNKYYASLRMLGIIIVLLNLSVFIINMIGSLLHTFDISAVFNFMSLVYIGLVLFVLTKHKKTMFVIYSIGLFAEIYFYVYIYSYNGFHYPILQYRYELSNYLANNSYLNYVICLIILLTLIILFDILIWFYCYFEIKNKQKVINEEIITQSIETDQEQ